MFLPQCLQNRSIIFRGGVSCLPAALLFCFVLADLVFVVKLTSQLSKNTQPQIRLHRTQSKICFMLENGICDIKQLNIYNKKNVLEVLN